MRVKRISFRLRALSRFQKQQFLVKNYSHGGLTSVSPLPATAAKFYRTFVTSPFTETNCCILQVELRMERVNISATAKEKDETFWK
jgi:hypothetical protein